MLNKSLHIYLIASALMVFAFFGFKAGSDNPNGSRSGTMSSDSKNFAPPMTPNTVVLYTDHFDGPNDTNSLKARGYKTWYRGTGLQGPQATWFTPDGSVFAAFEGPATGFVAANYQVVTGANNIDSWLVLPYQSGGYNAGDSISFWTRTEALSTWPDSITVSYSAIGDSIPEGSWVTLGRLLCPPAGWTNFRFAVPTTSATGRLAIRYKVVDGGPSGNNSDYIGVDLLTVSRNTTGITPVSNQTPTQYSLGQNYPNPFNPSTKFNFALPKSGQVKLSVYDVLGNEIAKVVDQYYTAGTYSVDFNASQLSSGVYFYKLTTGDFSKTMKMTLVK